MVNTFVSFFDPANFNFLLTIENTEVSFSLVRSFDIAVIADAWQTGVWKGFFLGLPISVGYIMILRTSIFDHWKLGFISIFGKCLGELFIIFSIILGWRSLFHFWYFCGPVFMFFSVSYVFYTTCFDSPNDYRLLKTARQKDKSQIEYAMGFCAQLFLGLTQQTYICHRLSSISLEWDEKLPFGTLFKTSEGFIDQSLFGATPSFCLGLISGYLFASLSWFYFGNYCFNSLFRGISSILVNTRVDLTGYAEAIDKGLSHQYTAPITTRIYLNLIQPALRKVKKYIAYVVRIVVISLFWVHLANYPASYVPAEGIQVISQRLDSAIYDSNFEKQVPEITDPAMIPFIEKMLEVNPEPPTEIHGKLLKSKKAPPPPEKPEQLVEYEKMIKQRGGVVIGDRVYSRQLLTRFGPFMPIQKYGDTWGWGRYSEDSKYKYKERDATNDSQMNKIIKKAELFDKFRYTIVHGSRKIRAIIPYYTDRLRTFFEEMEEARDQSPEYLERDKERTLLDFMDNERDYEKKRDKENVPRFQPSLNFINIPLPKDKKPEKESDPNKPGQASAGERLGLGDTRSTFDRRVEGMRKDRSNSDKKSILSDVKAGESPWGFRFIAPTMYGTLNSNVELDQKALKNFNPQIINKLSLSDRQKLYKKRRKTLLRRELAKRDIKKLAEPEEDKKPKLKTLQTVLEDLDAQKVKLFETFPLRVQKTYVPVKKIYYEDPDAQKPIALPEMKTFDMEDIENEKDDDFMIELLKEKEVEDTENLSLSERIITQQPLKESDIPTLNQIKATEPVFTMSLLDDTKEIMDFQSFNEMKDYQPTRHIASLYQEKDIEEWARTTREVEEEEDTPLKALIQEDSNFKELQRDEASVSKKNKTKKEKRTILLEALKTDKERAFEVKKTLEIPELLKLHRNKSNIAKQKIDSFRSEADDIFDIRANIENIERKDGRSGVLDFFILKINEGNYVTPPDEDEGGVLRGSLDYDPFKEETVEENLFKTPELRTKSTPSKNSNKSDTKFSHQKPKVPKYKPIDISVPDDLKVPTKSTADKVDSLYKKSQEKFYEKNDMASLKVPSDWEIWRSSEFINIWQGLRQNILKASKTTSKKHSKKYASSTSKLKYIKEDSAPSVFEKSTEKSPPKNLKEEVKKPKDKKPYTYLFKRGPNGSLLVENNRDLSLDFRDIEENNYEFISFKGRPLLSFRRKPIAPRVINIEQGGRIDDDKFPFTIIFMSQEIDKDFTPSKYISKKVTQGIRKAAKPLYFQTRKVASFVARQSVPVFRHTKKFIGNALYYPNTKKKKVLKFANTSLLFYDCYATGKFLNLPGFRNKLPLNSFKTSPKKSLDGASTSSPPLEDFSIFDSETTTRTRFSNFLTHLTFRSGGIVFQPVLFNLIKNQGRKVNKNYIPSQGFLARSIKESLHQDDSIGIDSENSSSFTQTDTNTQKSLYTYHNTPLYRSLVKHSVSKMLNRELPSTIVHEAYKKTDTQAIKQKMFIYYQTKYSASRSDTIRFDESKTGQQLFTDLDIIETIDEPIEAENFDPSEYPLQNSETSEDETAEKKVQYFNSTGTIELPIGNEVSPKETDLEVNFESKLGRNIVKKGQKLKNDKSISSLFITNYGITKDSKMYQDLKNQKNMPILTNRIKISIPSFLKEKFDFPGKLLGSQRNIEKIKWNTVKSSDSVSRAQFLANGLDRKSYLNQNKANENILLELELDRPKVHPVCLKMLVSNKQKTKALKRILVDSLPFRTSSTNKRIFIRRVSVGQPLRAINVSNTDSTDLKAIFKLRTLWKPSNFAGINFRELPLQAVGFNGGVTPRLNLFWNQPIANDVIWDLNVPKFKGEKYLNKNRSPYTLGALSFEPNIGSQVLYDFADIPIDSDESLQPFLEDFWAAKMRLSTYDSWLNILPAKSTDPLYLKARNTVERLKQSQTARIMRSANDQRWYLRSKLEEVLSKGPRDFEKGQYEFYKLLLGFLNQYLKSFGFETPEDNIRLATGNFDSVRDSTTLIPSTGIVFLQKDTRYNPWDHEEIHVPEELDFSTFDPNPSLTDMLLSTQDLFFPELTPNILNEPLNDLEFEIDDGQD